MSEDEMKEIQPDFFVIDEYHRLGASLWGLHFQKLRNIYPNTPMLGLSATNIRYLDNQRDMADELFDGNTASTLSLGEAVVRGILNPPKYVLSIYSYKEELDRLETRIQNTKNKEVKHKAEQYLEALRRALEMAEGLDIVFKNNMDNRCGKYIVFCANYEHMQDIITSKINEWFHLVNKNVKIYTLYSGENGADKSFVEFKKDDDNTALRLLFCIDALNEGVHIEDVSGVILLRPTVSPIIYKQQIGRALSASKNTIPVIFDIVNNIENLYSIDSIKEEMQTAIKYFKNNGEGGMIVTEQFEIIDKVAECRELFRKLERTLSEGWELNFEKARDFYLRYGHLEVPKNNEFMTLYLWLTTQRKVYNKKAKGILTQAQIIKLDSIGMRWTSLSEANWKKHIEACKKYKEEHGDLLVPAKYTYEDINLGAFISNMRNYKKNSEKEDERIKELNELGMVWDISEYQFNKYYKCAVKYYEKHGAVNCASTYIDEETGLNLGSWCSNVRNSNKKLTDEQIKMLDEINFCWTNTFKEQWYNAFLEVKKYYEEHGNTDIPVSYKSNGFNTGIWIRNQREKYQNGKLDDEQIRLLKSINIELKISDPWEEKFKLLEKYYKEHGNLKIPADYIADGIWLNKWLNTQINAGEGKSKKILTDEQKNKLKTLGISFNGKRNIDDLWEEKIEQCRRFYAENGHLNITKEYDASLSSWLNAQRRFYRQGKLSPKIKKALEELKVNWSTKAEHAFQNGIEHARDYFNAYGNLEVLKDFVCSDGYTLGRFIVNQRSKYKNGKLTQAQINEFEKLGMIWNVNERNWDMSFENARRYFETHGYVPQKFSSNYTSEEYKIFEWIRSQMRHSENLSVEKAEKLNSIGIDVANKKGACRKST